MGNWLPPDFQDFIAPDTNRAAFLREWLTRRGIANTTMRTGNSDHILVRFADSSYTQAYRLKNIVAHYDRESGSQGANDNSAAVFQLLKLAEKLSRSPGRHNVRIIFTDKEEAPGKGSVMEQGSFELAREIRDPDGKEGCFFILDLCGRGDTLVLSTSGIDLLRHAKKPPEAFLQEMEALQSIVCWAMLAVNRGRFLSLPTPFSDNLGIVLWKIPAITLTMLPSSEAYEFAQRLQANGLLRQALVRQDSSGFGQRRMLKDALPYTWKSIHSQADRPELLDPMAFSAMEEVLSALVSLNLPIKFPQSHGDLRE